MNKVPSYNAESENSYSMVIRSYSQTIGTV